MHLRGRAERDGRAGARRPPGDRARPGRRAELSSRSLGRASARSRAASSATRTRRRRSIVATNRLRTNRVDAWDELPDVEELRERAHEIRMAVIDDLDRYLARVHGGARGARRARCTSRATAAEASAYVVEVCRRRGAKLVAKSKSMATEEIGLNEALEAVGIRPVETDLGEYILQLAGEHPAHIIAPAIEKTAERRRRAPLARSRAGRCRAELEALTHAARRQLREAFLDARTSASPARTSASPRPGSICLVTNEGNGRLVSARSRRCTSRSWAWSGSCRRSPTSPCCSSCSRAAAPGSS